MTAQIQHRAAGPAHQRTRRPDSRPRCSGCGVPIRNLAGEPYTDRDDQDGNGRCQWCGPVEPTHRCEACGTGTSDPAGHETLVHEGA